MANWPGTPITPDDRFSVSLTPFHPVATVATSAATPTPTRVAIPGAPTRTTIRLASLTGSGDYYVKFGDSTVVATTSDLLALGGTVEIFTATADATYISLLAATTTVTVNIAVGFGS